MVRVAWDVVVVVLVRYVVVEVRMVVDMDVDRKLVRVSVRVTVCVFVSVRVGIIVLVRDVIVVIDIRVVYVRRVYVDRPVLVSDVRVAFDLRRPGLADPVHIRLDPGRATERAAVGVLAARAGRNKATLVAGRVDIVEIVAFDPARADDGAGRMADPNGEIAPLRRSVGVDMVKVLSTLVSWII